MSPPAASATRKNMASVSSGMGVSAFVRFAGDFGGIERGAEPLIVAEVFRAFPEARTADTGRAVTADQAAVRVLAHHLVDEHVLRDDHVAFHAHYLGNVGDPARAVAQARGLNHHVD